MQLKVILSRKGFDSDFGGGPSPILDDGTLASIPIPAKDKITYSDVMATRSQSYQDLMNDLGIVVNRDYSSCHLDPDIDPLAIKRPEDWRGLFGQADKAESHLRKKNIKKGDLFLFFGWFRGLEIIDGKKKLSKFNDRHIIYGYLEVDEVVRLSEGESAPDWAKYHPHCDPRLMGETLNTLYIGKKNLSLNPKLPGYGRFFFSKKLELTKPGHSRSHWDLPKDVFQEVEMSWQYKDPWKDGYYQSPKRGQEFVIEDDLKIINWVKAFF
jgi:hypothetical protein